MDWKKTDPEFAERFEHFAFDKVVNEDGQQLPGETRYLAILATLIGCGGLPFPCPDRPRPPWRTGWKRVSRRRLPFSATA